MKIEKNKSKKSIGELPILTQNLIKTLLSCPEDELFKHLASVTVWRYGKCELYHWIDVLDRFDSILSKVTHYSSTSTCLYMCPAIREPKTKALILAVLDFTCLLIEHSYARHIYNSTEHLCVLLATPDLDIVLAVLNLLYIFGKRSNYISRLPAQQRSDLNSYLEYLGESWGGKQNGFGLAQCCEDVPLDKFPSTSTSVYFEYQPLNNEEEQSSSFLPHIITTRSIVLTSVDKISDDIADIIEQQVKIHKIPLVQQMRLLVRLRLAKHFGNFEHRVRCVLARLQAISVLVYSMAPTDVVDPLIYDGLVEELIEVLEIKNLYLQEIKAAVLRTLTAIIHLERDPRLGVIIEATGASTYHGFLPTLVRECVSAITSAGPDGTSNDFPLCFATSLFSFLYHLATYEASGDALVNSGIMESLLQVLQWTALHPTNITLVTRAVRVIDLITNLDMSLFHSLQGWDQMLLRLHNEVAECRKFVPNVLPTTVGKSSDGSVSMETDAPPIVDPDRVGGVEGLQCMPERAALIKSILNFVKKAIPDPMFTENIRNFVDSSLPTSLAHIVSNAEYYGPSIYLPATEVTTTFIFHDPSQLSSLQDNGLPWVILNSLINKKIPVTREVLSALPSILSSICLNSRGLQVFIESQPFDHLFGVLISPDYLPVMRRKRGNDPLGDTATNLGSAMDELMRHQPLLRNNVMVALVKLLKTLCSMGSHIGVGGASVTPDTSSSSSVKPNDDEVMTSDEEFDDDKGEDEEVTTIFKDKKTGLPLAEYTLNVVHFVDAILSNNSTDDHINEFINHGGLDPLLSLLSLPALPLNFSTSSACNSITATCKSILNFGRKGRLLKEAMEHLLEILNHLKPFIDSPQSGGESVLLKEINTMNPSMEQSLLLHHLSSAGNFIQLFIHLSKCGQVESRQLCIEHWASASGQAVLSQLSSLYRALVWEGFIVLAAASTSEALGEATTPTISSLINMVDLKTPGIDDSKDPTLLSTLKSFTPPLVVTSRVGRFLAELMSLLVRLCVYPNQRYPRRITIPYMPVSEDVLTVSSKVTDLLMDSLRWIVPDLLDKHVVDIAGKKKWLFSGMSFKMYAIDFCLLLLFDEHKQPYHLMLHNFSNKNVLQAFTDSFHSAIESIESIQDHGSLVFNADHAVTSDFLETWLTLAEKLINVSLVLESTHPLPVPSPPIGSGKKPSFNPLFNPLEFLVKARKCILPCIQKLWSLTNSNWMMPEVVRALISTIRQIYSNEKILNAKLNEFKGSTDKQKGPAPPSSSLSSSNRASSISLVHPHTMHQPFIPRADPLLLQQLMDMGFAREHSEDALLMTGNDLTASMEWILSHPPPAGPSNRLMSEEEQLAQAIALSLQNEVSQANEKMDQGETSKKEDLLQPLDGANLSSFSDQLLEWVLRIVCDIDDTVYQSCDLITSLCHYNGSQWKNSAMSMIKTMACQTMKDLTVKIQDNLYELPSGTIDPNAFHICLLALIMEEIPWTSSSVVCSVDVLEAAVALLMAAQEKLPEMKRNDQTRSTPLWLSSLLLILELWLCVQSFITWHKPPSKDFQAVWMYFETINSKWCYFGNEISRVLESSYRDGESFARIQTGRQKFIVNFSSLTQINVETGTQRIVQRLEVPKKDSKLDTAAEDNVPDLASFKCPSWFCAFSENHYISVIRSCTRLLSCDLDPNSLHANMRLILVLTRNGSLSEIFMKEKGPHALLLLTKKSNFQGFSSLSSLILRHILENGQLLEKGMESIIRSVLSGNNQDNEFKAHGPGRKDFDFILRRLTPCATRSKDLFVDTFARIARFNNLPPKLEDLTSTSRIAPTILRLNPSLVDRNTSAVLSHMQEELLNVLIDHLCKDAFMEDADSDGAFAKIDEETTDSPAVQLQYLGNPRMRRGSYRRQVTDEDELRSEDMILDMEHTSEPTDSRSTRPTQSHKTTSAKKDSSKEETDNSKQLLFSQAAILRLLAEMIESYPSTSRMVIESTRKIKIDHSSTTQTTKEISIIAFILDHLLPISYIQGNTATQLAKLAKVFLQTLATTNLPSDALNLFVGEFRTSFFRALSLSECQLKHHRIRALCGLLGQIVEPQAGTSSRMTLNPSQFVRLLIRKGFITDLAKAVHSFDLSTPLLTATINAILKPLECLTKIVNQFVAAQKRNRSGAGGQSSSSRMTSTVGNAMTAGEANVTLTREQPTAESRNNDDDRSQNDTGLECSLIPLQDEGEERDDIDDLETEEAMSIARELGQAARTQIDSNRHNDDEDEDDEQMDIEEIVDELLERTSTQNREDDSDDLSTDEDPLNDASNINSAGEEIGDEFDNQNDSYFMDRTYNEEDDDDDNDEEEEDIREDDHHDDQEGEEIIACGIDKLSSCSDITSDEEEIHGNEGDVIIEEREEIDDDAPPPPDQTIDETFDIEGEEFDGDDEEEDDEDDDDDDEDDDGLDLDGYNDNDIYPDIDFVHLELSPPWNIPGWRDVESIDNHQFDGITSLLSRAYHIRPPDAPFASTNLSFLPRCHPVLLRRVNHTHSQLPSHSIPVYYQSSNAEGSRGPVGGAGSRTDSGQQNTDIQRSNVIQQLLTSISTSVGMDEVLSFNVTANANHQPSGGNSRGTDSFNVSLAGGSESLESSYIPSNLLRWKEESQALDGYTAHLCMTALRPILVKRLKDEFLKEKKAPPTDVSKPQEVSVVVETAEPPEQHPPVPNPSDEATPAVATPRNGSESVNDLQTSLRAVADALAETVAEVRNAHLILNNTVSQLDNPIAPPTITTSAPTSTSDRQVPRTIASLPDLSHFDGSQDSARNLLSQLAPDDPLYTFLSAVARAPTPPLPESLSEPTNLSQAPPQLVSSSSSPRLPVFTQLLPSNPPSSVVVTIPVSDNTLTSATDNSPITTQLQPHPMTTPFSVSTFADALATELVRAVSHHLHPSLITPSTSSLPLTSHDSPSPSDTLAPMMSSLMPPSTTNRLPDNSTASSTSTAASTTSTTSDGTFSTATTTTTTSGSSSVIPDATPGGATAGATPSTSQAPPTFSDLPDDIDPTFLAALPDSIRREVLAQYAREQQRSRQQQQQQQQPTASATTTTTTNSEQLNQSINLEVLAALPPDIQEEVLQQQRMEQARQQQQSIDPSQPADAVSFLTSLTPDLRRTILSDMDDTLISQLPEDIATEAQTLRQQRENHRLQYMALQHARYENMAARLVPTWSGSNNMVTGPSHYRYAVFSPSEHRLTGFLPPYARVVYADNESKKMLDQEAMTCLLVLLFLDQNKLHFNRLFRIFRSLSQHADSRSWLISSLLSILCQANFSLPPSAHTCPTTVHSTSTPHHSKSSQPHWLTISINAALGSHANVFQFATAGKSPPSVYIHPHASVSICNNILELLIFLARQFPSSFLPSQLLPKDDKNPPAKNLTNNFWQILYHLDTVSGSRKGKSTSKTLHCPALDVLEDANGDIFGGSPIGQLMSLFSHSTIQSSVSLVDKLLRVLSVISGAIPKQNQSGAAESGSEATPTPTPTAVKKTDNLFISEVVIPTCFNKSVVPVSLLQNSINLLTSGKCSEDTLDDATSLLINLSRCGMETRETILLILMEGLKSIGRTLQGQIAVLLNEIISNSSLLAQNHLVNDKESVKSTTSGAGLGTVTGVVLPTARGARTTVDHSNDLHLPCMEPLVCKGSQQSFFLRLLKVVCQLRESAIITSHSSTTETPEVPPTSSSSVPTSSAAPNPSTDTTNQPTSSKSTQSKSFDLPPLSLQLELEELWSITSECLDALAATYDPHAVLALQQTVEAFFLVHAEQHDVSDKRNQRPSSLSRRVPHLSDATPDSPSFNDILSPVPLTPLHSESELVIDPYSHLPPDTARFLKFAERHRTVLNQILRQTIVPLSEGPFAVLVNHTRLLDFDVKRRYFRQELEQMDEGLRREDLVIHVRRNHVFEDSYRELYRRSSEEMKANLYVTFEGEEGQDAGGLLREWYLIIAREMFNPNYALFKTTPGDRVTYMPNPSSHINPEHLNYFKFVGRIIAKAIYDNKLLDCYFTRSFYKHILGKPVHYTDMESEDYAFYQGMVYLLEHNMDEMGIELTFSAEIEEFGKTDIRDLKANGREIPVTESNKREYVQLACQLKMTGSIRSQIKSFLDGFYDVIPKNLISIFNEQELELLISGLPNIDIDDLKSNTEYHKYTETSLQIQWFWRALRSCSQSDRARFLQFVTGTSKVPLQGFAALEGMNGVQKFQIHRDDRSTDRLPSAHTCFNQIDLPPYETYDKLQQMLLTAIRECPEGFGFA